jgi:CheY-like chemotaxis protein
MPMKILIAEKDLRSRNLLKVVLNAGGHAVTATGDGKGMASAMEAAQPDVILVNMFMVAAISEQPEVGGLPVADGLIPVVFFTSPAMSECFVNLLESIPNGSCCDQSFDDLSSGAKASAIERLLRWCDDLGRCQSLAAPMKKRRGVRLASAYGTAPA